jgi:hypothetical protein
MPSVSLPCFERLYQTLLEVYLPKNSDYMCFLLIYCAVILACRQNFRISCIIQSREGVDSAILLGTPELRFSTGEDVGNIAKFSRLKTHHKHIFLRLNFHPLHLLSSLLSSPPPGTNSRAHPISCNRISQKAFRFSISVLSRKRLLANFVFHSSHVKLVP